VLLNSIWILKPDNLLSIKSTYSRKLIIELLVQTYRKMLPKSYLLKNNYLKINDL